LLYRVLAVSPNSSRQPSRKQAQAARKARLDAMRKQQKRQQRRQSLFVIGGAVVVAAVVLGLVGVSIANRHSKTSALSTESISPAAPTGTAIKASPGTLDKTKKSAISGVQFWTGLARDHVTTPVTYAQVPPVGGQHNPVWLNCGVYNDPVPNVNAVHDLEHGAVWITYQPTLDAASKNALIKLAKSFKTFVTLSPYPNLPNKVVASAWGVQLKLDSATDPRLKDFVKTYRLGPQTPEPGAACTGGTGEPRGTVQAGDATPTVATSPAVVPTESSPASSVAATTPSASTP
jgi:hypothetical protein